MVSADSIGGSLRTATRVALAVPPLRPHIRAMHPLHITKVAVGCASADMLAERMAGRAAEGEVPVFTRYRPKRADELVGGSLYWIIKHRLVLRQTILGFAEAEEGRKCLIRLDARIVPVRALPKRAHQGWRYLDAAAAPEDFAGSADGDELELMPRRMVDELSALLLI